MMKKTLVCLVMAALMMTWGVAMAGGKKEHAKKKPPVAKKVKAAPEAKGNVVYVRSHPTSAPSKIVLGPGVVVQFLGDTHHISCPPVPKPKAKESK